MAIPDTVRAFPTGVVFPWAVLSVHIGLSGLTPTPCLARMMRCV